jgi:uncharacterized protein (TIGR03437 family)
VQYDDGPLYNDGNVDISAKALTLVWFGSQYSDLVFTAPVTGGYVVTGAFLGSQNNVGSTVAVVANGSMVFNSTVTSEGQIVPFDTTVTLNTGSTLVFSAGPGGGNQNTGLSATITGPFEAVPAAISSGGVVSASAFGEFSSAAPGSWIEIYGSNLAADTRGWTTADFTGVTAPTNLDGTTVTIGGQSAFIDYISPTQVNALVPSDVPTGLDQLTVTTAAGTSAAYNITINGAQPGFLAPAQFKVGGVQYAVAVHSDGTYVIPVGAIAGLTSRPAQPGETITLYGVGFGPVTPNISAGQLVQELNMLSLPLQLEIGGIPATASYDGLAPSYTGLYQFNVTVPAAPSGNQPLTFTLGGVSGTQTLNIAVGS